MSGKSLCLVGVMYGGGFVRGGFVLATWCNTLATSPLTYLQSLLKSAAVFCGRIVNDVS